MFVLKNKTPFKYLRINRNSVFALCFVFLLLFANFRYNQPTQFRFSHSNVSGVCTLPDIDPFDEEIMKFNWHPDPVVCDDSPPFMYIDRKGFIHINTTTVKKLAVGDIHCSYQHVERHEDDDVIFKPEMYVTKPEYVDSDFIVARCRDRYKKVLYENLLINVNSRPVLESRNIRKESPDRMSVLILGIDSLSRNSAIRKLPKTMKYVEDVLGGITFKGFTKVGENTFPNLVPLLTGRKADPKELPHVFDEAYYDSMPLIHHNFSRAGYATLYAEDWPAFSTFNYAANGFKIQPSDHYIRPLYLAMKKLQPLTTSLDQVLLYLEDKNIKLKSSSLCFQGRLKHLMFLEYYKRFVDSYKNEAKFAFTWLNEISHDYSNFLEIADHDFVQFLTWLKMSGHLDNSVLVLISDHGSRSEAIRNTVAGRIEVRMPLLSVVLPGRFKQRHPDLIDTLLQNTKVITTPFDVHAFIADVLHNNFDQKPLSKKDGKLAREISLFRKIPKERTCTDAGIHELYCACFTSTRVNVSTAIVTEIARASITKINLLLARVKDKCAELTLSTIKDAQLIESNFKRVVEYEKFTLRNFIFQPEQDRRKYLILFKAAPSNALFEVTASVASDNAIDLGDILRTNKYRDQSKCMVDRLLRNYCLCV
ncbi:uncharacterized protein [Argopecten irradians]|uniref:uncharacterized protein n=1 Tax=Argopecten irradians TaxID=31199 RepID=UPI00371EA41D